MIANKEAIESAADYLKSLASLPDGLGDDPEAIRLESIRQSGDDWTVTLSYTPKSKPDRTKGKPDWWKILEGVRRYKELIVEGKTGHVTAMRDPRLAA